MKRPFLFIAIASITFISFAQAPIKTPSGKSTTIKKSITTNKGRASARKTASANTLNGHEYVDLGLPSGTKWATTNIGATTPFDYGDYFAFGETSPKKEYSEQNYTLGDMSGRNISGNKALDAATALWGPQWHIPTTAEWEELKRECIFRWHKGGNGEAAYAEAVGPNGNIIIFPCAGVNSTDKGGIVYDEDYGEYWQPEAIGGGAQYFVEIQVDNKEIKIKDYYYNTYYGLPIRPVTKK